MNVAMMQPAFMPWQGFFELIDKADIFIILDDFQFSLQSYQQRNRLFVSKGKVAWYTVPVQKNISFKAPLNEVRIDENNPWRNRLWERIHQNYRKADYYDNIAPILKEWIFKPAGSLAEQNIALIQMLCSLFDIKTEFRFSSEYQTSQKRSARVLELLEWVKADRYYCARGSFAYMLEDKVFPVERIDVKFQNFQPRAYKQVGAVDEFVPYLSVLDALMNIGATQTADLIKDGTIKWLCWEEMLEDMVKEE